MTTTETTDTTDTTVYSSDASALPEPAGAPERPVRVLTATLTDCSADIATAKVPDGREVIIPVTEYLEGSRWSRGDRVPVVIAGSGSRPVASTASEAVVIGLLDGIVPEIRDGRVQVMGIARQAGVRTKLSVAATVADLDPVAACVGRAANRVRQLCTVLGGEKVDVIAWNEDRLTHARNALAPAQVTSIELVDDVPGAAKAHTPRHQMAAAVGEGGLNSLLAGVLAGLAITVVADT